MAAAALAEAADDGTTSGKEALEALDDWEDWDEEESELSWLKEAKKDMVIISVLTDGNQRKGDDYHGLPLSSKTPTSTWRIDP